MDDYSVSSLTESKNEWCARLLNIMTPSVIVGIKSIFDEAWTLCKENNEEKKYLMTFQTFLSRVPKWNQEIIKNERNRIAEVTNCSYLEDLITCVHIIQLKALTCIRVGQEQKKVEINIPSIDTFIHKVYINVARKVYTNVYIFEKGISPLEVQKHNRELEIIVKETIMNTIREGIPVEELLKAYICETHEEEVDIQEELIEDEPKETPSESKEPDCDVEIKDKINFSDIDDAIDTLGKRSKIDAPKTIERLEKISNEAQIKRKQEENEDEDNPTLILGEDVSFDILDIKDLNEPIHIKTHPLVEIETL
jgi:hypothetical protein